ncbi:hypothetical protein L2E82_00961 [Cichorium intybus]|uniref:Uncharacterized protein n=1 Tax=Cichorium intybus TaxID=13427 RepID=A0ACB9GZS1_CICIN|nr:hypothetical protein L2E82_00961 [Cichorium intybus]
MAMRELVTGGAECAVADSSSSSNPLGALANVLIVSSSQKGNAHINEDIIELKSMLQKEISLQKRAEEQIHNLRNSQFCPSEADANADVIKLQNLLDDETRQKQQLEEEVMLLQSRLSELSFGSGQKFANEESSGTSVEVEVVNGGSNGPSITEEEEPRGQRPLIFDQGNRISQGIRCADVADICVKALHDSTASNKSFDVGMRKEKKKEKNQQGIVGNRCIWVDSTLHMQLYGEDNEIPEF